MNSFNIEGIEIFSSVYEYLDSNMYVFFPCEGVAVMIDPHVDAECLKLFEEKKVTKIYIILTHEHTDHTSGIFWYQEMFDCQIICQKNCAAYIADEKRMRPLLIPCVLEGKDRTNGTTLLEKFKREYIICTYQVDITYENKFDYTIGNYHIHFEHIPGHSRGSSLIVVNDKFAFAGDSLMKENPVITRFPGSNHQQYVEFTLPKLSSLSKELKILPGHGVPFTLKELMVNGKLKIDYR